MGGIAGIAGHPFIGPQMSGCPKPGYGRIELSTNCFPAHSDGSVPGVQRAKSLLHPIRPRNSDAKLPLTALRIALAVEAQFLHGLDAVPGSHVKTRLSKTYIPKL